MSEAERSVLRRGQFGIVLQFEQLLPELTAVQNVPLPLLLRDMAVSPPGERPRRGSSGSESSTSRTLHPASCQAASSNESQSPGSS